MPSRSQAPFTAGSIGSAASSSTHRQAACPGPARWHTVPTPPAGRVAEPAGARRRRDSRLDELAERRGVGARCRPRGRGRRGPASPPCRGRRSCPTRARRSPGRTSSGPSRRPGGHDAHARGGDVQAVGGAPVHHLGVAGDDGDPGAGGGVGHVGDDGPQLLDRPSPPPGRRRPRSTAGGRPSWRRR